MPKITFPDGRIEDFEDGITPLKIAEKISLNLAKKSTAALINFKLNDISRILNGDCELKIITNDSGDKDCLEILRHDAAHILAQALKELYGNEIQITIGPNIENGFYYDISSKITISTENFPKIEAKMLEIVKRNEQITREEWSKEQAIEYFKSIGENYKVEIIEDLFNKEKICLCHENSSIHPNECCVLQNKEKIGRIYHDGNNDFLINIDDLKLNMVIILQCIKNIIEPRHNNTEGSNTSELFNIDWNNPEITIFGISEEEVKYYKQAGFEESHREGGFEKILKFNHSNITMKFNKSTFEKETVTIYKQGSFIDLCRGPHAPSTGMTKYFKLLKVSGAYWRGDSKNEQLQRIYGTAWHSKKALDEYLLMLEEAEKRDHRKIGQELDLFHVQEEAAGSVFWHPNGWTIYLIIENYIRQKIRENGYLEVKTPQMVDKILWEKSGHWEKFKENMFICETEDKTFAIKPMNCPCHVQIFNQKLYSYRDLPLRMAEFGCCHRNESSGSLHGIMRVRSMTQDDAHIFCMQSQIESETMAFCKLLFEVYKKFGFDDVEIKFSTRPEKRAGTDEIWDKAEEMLSNAVKNCGYQYEIQPGEGAFYGPKLEFHLKDAIGRKWQCGTLQLDFVLPDRLGAKFINEKGEKDTPVMLHRAILGSLERFIGILIENYAGKLPIWLTPVQAVVCTITNDVDDYASQVFKEIKNAGIRAILDTENATLNYKIRKHSSKKIPYIIILGKTEAEKGNISIRELGSNEAKIISVAEFVDRLPCY